MWHLICSARRVIAVPFTHRYAAPVWLLVRLHLAWMWLRFGVAKIRDGWLAENPLHDLLGAVAQGYTATPLEPYRHVAELLLAVGGDRALSVLIPIFEVAVGLMFLSGIGLVPAAILASLLNVNLILSGVATWAFDGRFIALQLLLLAAWRVAGRLGAGTLLKRSVFGSVVDPRTRHRVA
jgi:uncharacterized membrane protein YphA (DoxX/SURF4 family)